MASWRAWTENRPCNFSCVRRRYCLQWVNIVFGYRRGPQIAMNVFLWLLVFVDLRAKPRSLLFLSLTLSVCLSVRLSGCLSRTNVKLILLFCFSMESSHFLAISCPWPPLQNLFSIFDLGPLTPQIYSPKFFMARVWWQLGQSVHTKTCMWGRPLLLWQQNLG